MHAPRGSPVTRFHKGTPFGVGYLYRGTLNTQRKKGTTSTEKKGTTSTTGPHPTGGSQGLTFEGFGDRQSQGHCWATEIAN